MQMIFCFLHPANCSDADISRKMSQHVASALSLGGQVLEIFNHYNSACTGWVLVAPVMKWLFHCHPITLQVLVHKHVHVSMLV